MLLKDAIQKPIPPGSNDPPITPVGIVFHVSGGTGNSLYNVFHSRGGIESHFYVRYYGAIEQYRDTTIEADAQNAGNSWVSGGTRYGLISVETEGTCDTNWTPQQLASLQHIMRATWDGHKWPLRVCPSPTQGGIGYHALFDAWNVHHHACPCPSRIQQFNRILVPYLHDLPSAPISIPAPISTPAPNGDHMLFVAKNTNGADDVYVAKADGVTLHKLAGGPADAVDLGYHDFLDAGYRPVRGTRKTIEGLGYKFEANASPA